MIRREIINKPVPSSGHQGSLCGISQSLTAFIYKVPGQWGSAVEIITVQIPKQHLNTSTASFYGI